MPLTMPNSFEEHLDHGREAVGGAAGVGDDIVLGWIVLVLVDAEDESHVFIGGRGGDDDLFHGLAEVGFGLGGIGEVAGGFDDDLRACGGPVQLGGITLGEDFDLLAIDGNEVFAGDYIIGDVAQNRIVLKKMGEDCGTGEVVYGNEINLRVTQSCAEDVAADAAESIDANLNCHVLSLLELLTICACGRSTKMKR